MAYLSKVLGDFLRENRDTKSTYSRWWLDGLGFTSYKTMGLTSQRLSFHRPSCHSWLYYRDVMYTPSKLFGPRDHVFIGLYRFRTIMLRKRSKMMGSSLQRNFLIWYPIGPAPLFTAMGCRLGSFIVLHAFTGNWILATDNSHWGRMTLLNANICWQECFHCHRQSTLDPSLPMKRPRIPSSLLEGTYLWDSLLE